MNYRKLPGIYDIENGESLLEGVRNGDTLSFDRMVLGHTRIAARIVNSLAHQWQVLYLRSDLDSVAYVAIVIAVNNIREKRLRHDNFTSYIACYVRGYVRDAIKKAKKYAPLEYELSCVDCGPVVIDTVDEIYSVCHSATERKIFDLRRQGCTDMDISKKLKCHRSRITQIRLELKARFNRKVQNGTKLARTVRCDVGEPS